MLNVALGEAFEATVAFTDAAGQPMAATGVVMAARRPDGTVVAGTPAPADGTGRFKAVFVGDAHGVWLVKGECAGPEVARDETRVRVSRLAFDAA